VFGKIELDKIRDGEFSLIIKGNKEVNKYKM